MPLRGRRPTPRVLALSASSNLDGDRPSNDATAPPAASRPVDDLYALAYTELLRRASAVRRRDPFASVSTSTLVHEAWFKFANDSTVRFESQQHLVQIVVRAMRQVLVDVARYRRAECRSGIEVSVDEAIAEPCRSADVALEVSAALAELQELDPELAGLVEMRYLGGFSVLEISQIMEMSESSVRRKCKLALAWLKVSLQQDGLDSLTAGIAATLPV
jgi:RNA polymerase sigma factor (TIGR02999 family)